MYVCKIWCGIYWPPDHCIMAVKWLSNIVGLLSFGFQIFLYILYPWYVFYSLISRRFIFFPISPMVICSWNYFPIVHFIVSLSLHKPRKQEKFVPGWGSYFRYVVDKHQYLTLLKTITSWLTSGWFMASKLIIALLAGLSTPSIQLADYVYSKERESMDIKAWLWKPYLFHAVIAKRTSHFLLKQATRYNISQ